MSIKHAARTKDNFVTVEIMSDTVFIVHVQNNIASLFIIDYVVSVLKLFVLRLSKSVAIPGATCFGAEFLMPACLYNLFIVYAAVKSVFVKLKFCKYEYKQTF
jgi:hypothetical protein